MTLHLSEGDHAKLSGHSGPATRLAMSIVVQIAEVLGAPELMNIESAHVDSTIYIGDAGLEFAERLASMGARVAVPTTSNVSGLDEHHWQKWSVPIEWAQKAHRQMVAYQDMGCIPTWTCAPYQTEWRPLFGQQIAWGESNAIVYANSVIGARTERYPDFLDICCAITGRVPAIGLHLPENRFGEVLVRLVEVPPLIQSTDTFYAVLGYLIGKLAMDRIPVIEGMVAKPTEDQLKALGAAAASAGAVALFHIVGITPEAPSLARVFPHRPPSQVFNVTMGDLRRAFQELTTGEGSELDVVVLGCPHFSIAEFQSLASLLKGKHLHPAVDFLITSSRAMTTLAEEAGFLRILDDFGARIAVDTCTLASPMLPRETRVIMTNSAKCAYYGPGLLHARAHFGSTEDCVQSAVAGHVVHGDLLWNI